MTRRNQALWDKLQEAYLLAPDASRYKLAQMAGTTASMAQRFLASYRRTANTIKDDSPLSNLHEFEQSLILKGLTVPPQPPPIEVKWNKDCIRFAALGDSHIGHVKAHKEWWDIMCDKVDKEKVDFCLHTGDITEGMSGRDGHVYELEAIGASAQLELAALRIEQIPCVVKGITGNHDLWGYKTIGFDPGAELQKRCKNFVYLGQNEATITVAGLQIMLTHPGDGSAYAVSYAMQQFINALSGGEKPHIMLMGHHHKSIYMHYRNIQAFETGTLCAQTGWMRGKKLQAHCGFWIIEVWPNDNGVERIRSEWVPFYSKGE